MNAEIFQAMLAAESLREIAAELQNIIAAAAEAERALQRVLDLQKKL